MLENTFRHLSGFGALRERRLWAKGIWDWGGYERLSQTQLSIFAQASSAACSELDASRRALAAEDADFFASRLPKAEHYRVALAYPDKALFLDIETTGLSLFYDEITIIGLSLGGEYRFHIAGQTIRSAADWLERAKCVVTFNGTLFDLKFLRQEYPELRLPKAHVGRVAKVVEIRRRGFESMVVGIRRRGQGRQVSARGSASRRPGAW